MTGNNGDMIPVKYRRNSIPHLITEGLHYCCVWGFFRYYLRKSSALIAARLGVTQRAVEKQRVRMEAGCYKCESTPSCLLKRKPTSSP